MGKKVWNCPQNDVRFSEVNITKWCYQSYLDYNRCTILLGKEYKKCNMFKETYTSLCPIAWVEKWNEQIENGTFAGVLPECQE